MFHKKSLRLMSVLAVVTMAFTMIPGCSGSTLPESVTITLPDGTETEATLGSGVLSLANTSWTFYQGSVITGTPFVTLTFGSVGELTAFEDNTLSQEIFGDTIFFDGKSHNTAFPGLTYVAATYGAETSDATGFSFVGQLDAFAVILGQVADGVADATGTFDANDPNIMTGNFSFDVTILVDIPGMTVQDTTMAFAFIAQKVTQ